MATKHKVLLSRFTPRTLCHVNPVAHIDAAFSFVRLECCIIETKYSEKSNSIIPHRDVITAFSVGAFVRGIASQREKKRKEKNEDT